MRKKIDWRKYAPPGMETKQIEGFFVLGLICSALYSLFFLNNYWDAYEGLWKDFAKTQLWPGAQMEPFFELLNGYLSGYWILIAGMLGVVAANYLYFHQGSKSIYLMRRLPDGKYLHRVCWTLPLAAIGLCVLAILLSLAIYFGIYVTMTPQECLPW